MTRRDAADLAGSAGAGAWAAFAVVAVVAGGRGTPLTVDERLLSWSLGHRPEVAVALARGLTATGTGVVPYALVALGDCSSALPHGSARWRWPWGPPAWSRARPCAPA